MSDPIIPSFTDKRREAAEGLIPGDETDFVYEAYKECLSKFIASLPAPLVVTDIENPRDPAEMDSLIKSALVSMAKKRVRGGLAKLAWMSHVCFDPDMALDWSDAKHLPMAVLHRRIHQSDFYLSEFRALSEHSDGSDWKVQVRSPDGSGVVMKDRVFPMWGIEFTHGLDNHLKAQAWYRTQLKERGIVR